MAKNNSNKPLFTIDILLDKFTDYLRDQNFTEDSIVKYKGVHVFFDSNFRGQVMKGQEKNFMDLVPKLLFTKSFSDIYKDRNGNVIKVLTGWDIINNIITGIDNGLFKNKMLSKKTKTESNYQSYANKFFKFIKTIYGNRNSKYHITKLTKVYNIPKLSAADLAVLRGEDGEIYLNNKLRTKFKSRLRCQDRTSGDKIWLPLRFIGKIYSADKKAYEKKNPGKKKKNKFSEWLDDLVGSINIHYYNENNGKVEHLTINDGVSLWLKPLKRGSKVHDVIIFDSNGSHYTVLTPTGKGNKKECMKVRDISEIAIDHVKSIDRTLRDLSDEVNNYYNNQLVQLMKVSEKYKAIQTEEEPDEDKAVNELLKPGKYKINLTKLTKELGLIKNDGLLRLMASKYNSQKSNGETFQDIFERGNKTYYGIIETEIIDQNGVNMTLYQELTDNLSQTGSLTISKSTSPCLNGQNVNGIQGFQLGTIIDKI